MLTTLNGMFLKPKPHRVNFIKENKRKLKEISSMVNQNHSKSRFDLTKSKSSQTEVSKRGSSTGLKENKNTPSGCRLSSKGSMTVFLQEKKDKGSISSISLSPKQKSSHKVHTLKNQSCQTIDPRRCDQLFHEGVIKYPSNKVLQELAEIEKQKANRLDVHVKKEYYRRNKIKVRSPHRMVVPKVHAKVSEKTDEKGDRNHTECEEVEKEKEQEEVEKEVVDEKEDEVDAEDEDEEDDEEEEEEEVKEQTKKQIPPKENPTNAKPTKPMRAAEIIRKTTEDHLNYSPRNRTQSNHHLGSTKTDNKGNRKVQKKISREDEVLKTVLDPQCPPGHIPLPDSERKKTLQMLKVSHAELVREMNLLPVRTDTLRVRQRKIQLENQLNKIEEGIKVFSKSKVYVKIEE